MRARAKRIKEYSSMSWEKKFNQILVYVVEHKQEVLAELKTTPSVIEAIIRVIEHHQKEL